MSFVYYWAALLWPGWNRWRINLSISWSVFKCWQEGSWVSSKRIILINILRTFIDFYFAGIIQKRILNDSLNERFIID